MKTPSMLKVLPLAAAGAALFASMGANALSIGLDVGANGYDVILNDQQAGDLFAGVGGVTLVTSMGTWTLIATNGTSQPLLAPPRVDLNNVSVTSTGAGTLLVSVWDTYAPAPGVPAFQGAIGGTTGGNVTVTYSQYQAGGAMGVLGGGHTGAPISGVSDGPFGPVAFSGTKVFPHAGNPTHPFDLGIDVTIRHTGPAATSFNALIQPVPIPAAALLFGSALLGMVGFGRRGGAPG